MTYIASPFFNGFQKIIRDMMVSSLDDLNDIFRPDLTETSKSYDLSPGEELANQILEDNINGIKSCSSLIFPKYTNDLGTLVEVGIAIKLGKELRCYDSLTGATEVILVLDDDGFKLNYHDVVDMSYLSSAILLGYNLDNANQIGYYLPWSMNDNIMLKPFNRFGLYKQNYVKQNVTIVQGSTANGEKGSRKVTPIKFNPKEISTPSIIWESGFENINLIHRDLDFILGDGQSTKKLDTGVS